MEWKSDLAGSRVHFKAEADESSSERLAESFRSLFEKLRAEVLPAYEGSGWDHIRVEIWSDTGRIFAGPDASGAHLPERARCELSLPNLRRFWEDLADSDTEDDEFSRRAYEEERRCGALLVKTWTEARAEANARLVPLIVCSHGESGPLLEGVVSV